MISAMFTINYIDGTECNGTVKLNSLKALSEWALTVMTNEPKASSFIFVVVVGTK